MSFLVTAARRRRLATLLLVAAAVGWFGPPGQLAAAEQPLTFREADGFAPGGAGEFNDLGVSVEVLPELEGHRIRGFVVTVQYRDPALSNAPNRVLINKQFLPADCDDLPYPYRSGPATAWENKRAVSYALQFEVACRSPGPGLPPLAMLLTRFGCSDAAGERALISAIRRGKLFAITPTSSTSEQRTVTGHVIAIADKAIPVISVVLTVADLVTVIQGKLTITRFAMRTLAATSAEELVRSGLKYVDDRMGRRLVVEYTGWRFECNICGEVFFRSELTDGEVVACPGTCDQKARLHLRE